MTENYNFEIKRREIYWVSCEGVVSRPGVQQKDRPYLIVSNDLANKNSSVLTGVPLTSNLCKKKLPTHCIITIENICNNPPIRTNIALCEQITSISKKTYFNLLVN